MTGHTGLCTSCVYGNIHKKTSTNVTKCLNLGYTKLIPCHWISLIIAIAKGVAHFHDHGYLHGSVNTGHVIIYTDIFGNNCKYKAKLVGLANSSKNNEADKIREEIFSLGQLINENIPTFRAKASIVIIFSFKDNKQKKNNKTFSTRNC